MATNTKALAEQYLREYRSTPELGNWDHVIELGKKLAESVVAENKLEPRTAQPAKQHDPKLNPTTEEIELVKHGAMVQAVKSLCARIPGTSIPVAKAVLDQYRPA